MTHNNLKQKFRAWHKDNYNFMTPKIHRLERADNQIIEIATDKRKEMFGVGVWKPTKDPEGFEATHHDLNKPFHDKNEALEYAELLKQKLRGHAEIEDIINNQE